MIQSCGATYDDIQGALNIVEDSSINTTINASNRIVISGNNSNVSEITMESLASIGATSNQKECYLNIINQNLNSTKMDGGTGGDVGGTTGANENINTTE